MAQDPNRAAELARAEAAEANARAEVERLRKSVTPDARLIEARKVLAAREAEARQVEHAALRAEMEYLVADIEKARAALRTAAADKRDVVQQRLDALLRDKQKKVADARTAVLAAREQARQAATAPELREPGPTAEVRAAERAHASALAALERVRAAERDAGLQVSRNELTKQRGALEAATAKRRTATGRVSVLAEAVRTAERVYGVNSAEYRAASDKLAKGRNDLQAAFVAERAAKGTLAGALGAFLPRDPAEEIRRLSARFPITLFPVRIETRFVGAELRVRIYPDEILAPTHDPRLTRDEVQAGQAYWATAWDPAKEPDAWALIVKTYSPRRSAWIAKAMEPINMAERGTAAPPQFPSEYADPATVPQSYAHRIEATLLPDRWLVVCYRRGTEVRRAVSGPVQDPLALTVSGDVPESDLVDISGDGLKLDRDVLWTIDFVRAEAVGMAVRMTGLTSTDLHEGFDRLLVVGIKSSLEPVDGAGKLGELFTRHRYGRGLALVPQGTPTNNTGTTPSGYPPDEEAAQTYARERSGLALTDESDGRRVFRALGLAETSVADLAPHIAAADRTEDVGARAMNTALWPATWGYTLEQMMDPEISLGLVREVRRFFIDSVRGRGPLPAFRIGGTPYGVLPTVSVERWKSGMPPHGPAPGSHNTLPDILRRLRPLWLAATAGVPRAGRTPGDPDKDLIEILGLDASAREVRLREVYGVDFHRNLFGLFGISGERWDDWVAGSWWRGRLLFSLLGYPGIDPRLVGVVFNDIATLFRDPLVAPEPLSESLPLQPNYITWLAAASVDELRDSRPPGLTVSPLLYLMLRHAALLTYGTAAYDLHQLHLREVIIDRREMELVHIAPGTEQAPTIYDRLDATVPEVTPLMPIKDYVRTPAGRAALSELQAYQTSLGDLELLPAAELERLFTETLDACSHRLDAWLTSLASRRLAELRRLDNPGTYIGAFAWVENLKPLAPQRRVARTLRDGRVLAAQSDSGGHIHAPSIPHAAAAAVLRNAYLTRSVDTQGRYAVDLSSARVRRALWLLDAVRGGQPLAAVFGYLIERWLDEALLQVYKEPLRQLYPMPGLVDVPANTPSETIAARDVVNGWRFYEAADPLAGLQIAAGDRPALDAIIRQLREVADAVADLLTADAVYQIVSGATSSAASSLDALSKGARPPEPQIAHTPRSGTALTHRIAVTLNAQAASNVAGWTVTERATLEPALNAWAAQVLGNPTNVRCRTTYLSPQPADPQHRDPLPVTLADLAIAPLDVLALAQGVEAGAAASELDRRIAYFVLATAPEGSNVEITYDPDPTWDRSVVRTFPELLELARSLNATLSSARPLKPEDLLLPERVEAVQDADRRLPDAVARAGTARQALQTARAALFTALSDVLSGAAPNLDALRAGLMAAAQFGIAGAVPVSRKGVGAAREAELVPQAKSVLKEVDSRLTSESQETKPHQRVSILFANTVKFVPAFNVVGAAELEQAIADSAALVGDPFEPIKWLQRAARVHAGAGLLRRTGLYAGALGTQLPAFEIAQLPYKAGAKWVALPFATEDDRPPSGRVSIALLRPTPRPLNVPWAGLTIDEWNEAIPFPAEVTGLAFHYDDPGAEAAQTVLIAVPPANVESWDLPTVLATLNETFELAQIRGVDGDVLGTLSQVLPAIYLASNTKQDTIETNFAALRIDEAVIAAPFQ